MQLIKRPLTKFAVIHGKLIPVQCGDKAWYAALAVIWVPTVSLTTGWDSWYLSINVSIETFTRSTQCFEHWLRKHWVCAKTLMPCLLFSM